MVFPEVHISFTLILFDMTKIWSHGHVLLTCFVQNLYVCFPFI